MKHSIRLRSAALLSGLLLLADISGCSKEPDASAPSSAAAPTPGAPAPAAASSDTFGFMSQLPKDIESYTGMYNSRKVWQRFFKSNAYAALRASHLFQQPPGGAAAQVPGAQTALDFFSPDGDKTISDPHVLALRHIVADAFGTEWFMSFASGSTESLGTWEQLLKEFRTQQRIQSFKGMAAPLSGQKPNPNWMAGALPALVPYIHSLDCPPMILGFKMSAQKVALQAEIDRLRKTLPPTVTIASFNVGDKPFTSWTFVAGNLIPPDKQQEIKAFLEANLPDKAAADDDFQALLSRKAEAAFGYVGDYFLVSVGPDHSHLKLAASPADSLLQRPEMSVLTPYGDKAVFTVAWSCQKIIELLAQQQDLSMLPAFESLKPSLASTLSDKEVEQLEADLRRIDGKGKDLLRPTVIQAAVAVSYWKDGLRMEQYGGVLPAGMATGKPLAFDPADLASNFIWLDCQAHPAFKKAMLDWLQDITKTSLDFYQHTVLPKLGPQKAVQFAMAQGLVLPKLIALYHITRDQLSKSLGTESAFAIDLNGAVPALPPVPAPIQQKGKMPRIAAMRDVVDAKLLGQSWASYLALARQIAVFLPPKMQLPGGIPDAQHKDLGGADMYFYPLPMDTGDLLPNVTVSGSTAFIASTSPAYSSALSGALKGGAGSAPSALKIDIRMTAAYDFAETWLGIVAEHPELFFTKDPDAGTRFAANEPKFLNILKGLRLFQGLEGRIYEENGGLRISSVFHIRDIH